jgi:RNA polymerase sigma-70 factor (ECF subfamily)
MMAAATESNADPDLELVMRARDLGDETALGELFGRYHARIYRFAQRLKANDLQADEVTRRTLDRMMVSIGDFKGRGSFKSWLFIIAKHEYASMRRKLSERTEIVPLEEGDDDCENCELVGDATQKLEHVAERRRKLEFCEQVIDELPEASREIVRLALIERMRYKEIAELTGKTPNAVAQIVRRALKWMQGEARRRYPGGDAK